MGILAVRYLSPIVTGCLLQTIRFELSFLFRVATGDSGMQTGRESIGRPIGFELFDDVDVEELAERAAHRALTKLNARPAPSGTMPVVIGSGGGGVLFPKHVAMGLKQIWLTNKHQSLLEKLGKVWLVSWSR